MNSYIRQFLILITIIVFSLVFFLKDLNLVSATYPVKFNKPYYILLAILIILYIFQTIKISPHYLAFANEFIGGPKNAYKYFADSNLDWNQNTLLFERYYQSHPEIVAVNPRKPIAGRIAVNVNEMNLYYYHQYQWLRDLKKDPTDNVGYTWLIFDIKPEEISH